MFRRKPLREVADKFIRNRKRIADLTKVIRWRCGTELPNDDAGRDYFALMLDHLLHLPDGHHRILMFAEHMAPWISAHDVEQFIDAHAGNPRRWTADDLGRELNLTYSDRRELGITTIAPADLTPTELAELRRQNKAEREAARRRAHSQKVQHPRPAGGLSPRASLILDVLRLEHRWFAVAEITPLVRSQFKDGRGRLAADASMRKLIGRALDELVAAGLISDRRTPAKNGFKVRSVRSNVEQSDQSDTANCHGDTVTIQ
jgi:hypothetical protein